jgi:hypothetical protein
MGNVANIIRQFALKNWAGREVVVALLDCRESVGNVSRISDVGECQKRYRGGLSIGEAK